MRDPQRWSRRYASPAFLPVLGYSPGDIEGTSVLNLVHIDDALIAREAVRDVLDSVGLVKSLDLRVQHADGSWRHLEVVATNLVENTAVNGVVLNARDVTDRVHVAARLRERAFHDELTGLPNRALMLERLRDSLQRASGRGRLVGVLFLDLDRFKIVNDSLGHAAGDDLLREVARRIRETVRPDDTVARLGGDEFVVEHQRHGAPHRRVNSKTALPQLPSANRSVSVVHRGGHHQCRHHRCRRSRGARRPLA